MSYLYTWQSVAINKSSRPILTDGEFNIYVKDGVGIYQGRLKIANHQNGRVYLTNRRIIYIDSADQSRAIAINLKDAARAQYVEKFLRSSPKVKVYLKIDDESALSAGSTNESPQSLLASLPLDKIVDWTCVICSFNNHISTKTDLDKHFPKCTSCGIPPSRNQITQVIRDAYDSLEPLQEPAFPENPHQCPKCTFINHPLMKYCELCGAELQTVLLALAKRIQRMESASTPSLKAQNPMGLVLEEKEEYTNKKPYIKVSFRKGGDLAFYEHVVQEIDKLKWENLENRGMVSGEATRVAKEEVAVPKVKTGGIHTLERIGQQQRKRNEVVLTQSLEDLEQLMYKAHDVLKVSSSFGALVKRKKNAPTATIPPLVISRSSSLYHQELARHISEYLLNVELTRITSMITIPDLFASYNRFQISSQGFGTDLLSTQDLTKSLELLDKLHLPIKVTTFQSGLEVVTQRSHELQDLHRTIMEFLVDQENSFKRNKIRSELVADSDEYTLDQYRYFHGNTVAEIAEHFGWSHTVCTEEMERCMDEQLVVFDRHILGTFYFVNQFDPELGRKLLDDNTVREQVALEVLAQQNDISLLLKSKLDMGQHLVAVTNHEYGILQSESVTPRSQSQSQSPPSLSLGDLAGLDFT